MFLKLRRANPWVLCVLAALCLSVGLTICHRDGNAGAMATSAIYGTEITYPLNSSIPIITDPTVIPTPDPDTTTSITGPVAGATDRVSKPLVYLGWFLCFLGASLGAVSLFLCPQKGPVLGPEAELALLVLAGKLPGALSNMGFSFQIVLYLVTVTAGLVSLRGLWWWLRSRCALSWCLPHRVGASGSLDNPQRYLLLHILWVTAASTAGILLWLAWKQATLGLVLGFAVLLAVLSLAKYGRGLEHLWHQTQNLLDSQPVDVRPGLFAPAEQQLQTLQTRHQEAIRTAVTSERFKVELISNVSHDLRTPLTSILGYSELLRRESLSPEGQWKLERLNQKAGYMRDLVESLFELTKVSSGTLECKREEIDLLRLLEQTIGLFDDQLTEAKLQVRRHYERDRLPMVTDGGRLHQIFANLMGNAIKYSLPGTRIHLEVKTGQDKCTVRMLNIASYEMDFQPEEILQRFARGDKARSTSGSGLGLAIAQTYTASVGGQFQVSIDGDQFCAQVTLPIPVPHPGQA